MNHDLDLIGPVQDLDGQNIETKFYNFLRDVVEDDGMVEIRAGESADPHFYFYQDEAIKMMQNNRSTLSVSFTHLIYVEEDLAEVIFFNYYRVPILYNGQN